MFKDGGLKLMNPHSLQTWTSSHEKVMRTIRVKGLEDADCLTGGVAWRRLGIHAISHLSAPSLRVSVVRPNGTFELSSDWRIGLIGG